MALTTEDIIQIIKENKALQLQIQRLLDMSKRQQTRYNDAENNIKALEGKVNGLKRKVYDLAQSSFSHKFSTMDIQSKPFDEMVNFLADCISENDMRLYETEKKEEEYTKTIEEYKKGIVELEGKIQELQDAIKDGSISSEVSEFDEDGEELDLPETEVFDIDKVLSDYKAGNKELFEKLLKTLNEQQLSVVKIIGDGNTLFSNIAKELNMANNNAKKVMDNHLSPKSIVRREVFASIGKGRPATHYFLTELGELILKEKFGQECKKTKKEELITHGSANHGGFIADVAALLEANGYAVKYEKPYTLIDGKKVIPDIVAVDDRTNEYVLIECERVRNPQDLPEKFDKYYQLFKEKQVPTNIIYFIVPEKSSDNNPLNLLQQELFKWVRDNKFGLKMFPPQDFAKAAVVFKTLTFEEYKQGKEPRAFFYGFKPKSK